MAICFCGFLSSSQVFSRVCQDSV